MNITVSWGADANTKTTSDSKGGDGQNMSDQEAGPSGVGAGAGM